VRLSAKLEKWFQGYVHRCALASNLREVVGLAKGLVVPAQVTLHRLFGCLLCVEDDIVSEGRNRGKFVTGRA
jgi:hypothetical protein